MKKDFNKNAVIVLGGNINALGVVRSFEETDIPVYSFGERKNFVMRSRFCKGVVCPHPNNEEFIDFLIQYRENFEVNPILFACADRFLMPIVKNKERLKNLYFIPVCDWDILSNLIVKEFLYPFAAEKGIPCPKTLQSQAKEMNKRTTSGFVFPIIIKPSITLSFAKKMGEKAYILNTQGEYEEFLEKLKKCEVDEMLIIQEYIPGDVDALYTITSFADRNHIIKGYSIGHKIRQSPPLTGGILSGHVKHVEEILRLSEIFIRESEFYGISNIEFKKDSRDGSYKLMEINPRTGLWNLSVLESGINLPMEAYKEVLGREVVREENKTDELIWCTTIQDFYNCVWGYKHKGYSNKSMSIKEWYKTVHLKGVKFVDSIFKIYDPLPFLYFYLFDAILQKFNKK